MLYGGKIFEIFCISVKYLLFWAYLGLYPFSWLARKIVGLFKLFAKQSVLSEENFNNMLE